MVPVSILSIAEVISRRKGINPGWANIDDVINANKSSELNNIKLEVNNADSLSLSELTINITLGTLVVIGIYTGCLALMNEDQKTVMLTFSGSVLVLAIILQGIKVMVIKNTSDKIIEIKNTEKSKAMNNENDLRA